MNKLLLPYRWKLPGMILSSAGVLLAVLFTWFDFRLKIPVFAVYSAFLETKMFVTFRTNFSDELTLLTLLTGLALVAFSKEKNEQQGFDLIRLKAMFRAAMVNTAFLFLSVLFIYGSGFMAVLVANLFSFFVLYLLFFYSGKLRANHADHQTLKIL
ncbi:MAG TPA: hypothetical protein PLG29_11695 [Lentimicrobium sp.]|nr:hypothetical protein [Lentimicrobium sp.]